ncbi:MAG: DUF885 domain-containing protein [Gammaproteobacteria bacterium]|nr:DUF885 domain-containing protein [Gammaproteobacteria bacterium]
MSRWKTIIAALLFGSVLLTGCDSSNEATQEQPEASSATSDKPQAPLLPSWQDFTTDFLKEYFAANPTEAVYQGLHEYDGQLPDNTPSGQQAYLRKLERWIGEVESMDPNQLSAMERFERNYLLAELREQKFWLEDVDYLDRSPIAWANYASPSVYLSRDYAPMDVRMRAMTTYLENLQPYLADMRMTISGDIPKTWVETALGMFTGFRGFFDTTVREKFAEVGTADEQAAFTEALDGALVEIDESITWLETKATTATDVFALGEKTYAKMLEATSMVDTSIAELKRIGEADLERNLAAMRRACDEFAPGTTLKACAAKAKSLKPADGPVAGAKRQLEMLEEFVIENDIVSIPSDDPVTVDEAPPYRRFNLAYISIPGPYEKTLPATYYIAPPDPEWTEAQRNQYVPGVGDLLFVSVHEVWPGHFLHFLHAKDTGTNIRGIFTDYAYTEGWAHYTEEMMYRAGLGKDDPQMHIGQLTNALLRNVRYLTSIGLHTGGMTVDEATQMFIDKGLQDPGNAQQQAYRGTYDPGFLNYTLGKLMIRKLREDYVGESGQAAWKQFHDEFLSYASAPVPMVREIMLDGKESDGRLLAVPEAKEE